MQIYCLSAINEENQNSLGWLFSNFVVFDSSANYEQNFNFRGWLLSNFLVTDSSGSMVQYYIVCEISIIRQLASVAEWLRHPTLNFGVPGSIPMENFFFFHFDIPATRPRHTGSFLVSNKWTWSEVYLLTNFKPFASNWSGPMVNCKLPLAPSFKMRPS